MSISSRMWIEYEIYPYYGVLYSSDKEWIISTWNIADVILIENKLQKNKYNMIPFIENCKAHQTKQCIVYENKNEYIILFMNTKWICGKAIKKTKGMMKQKILKKEERYETRGTWRLQSKVFFLQVDGGHYCCYIFYKYSCLIKNI